MRIRSRDLDCAVLPAARRGTAGSTSAERRTNPNDVSFVPFRPEHILASRGADGAKSGEFPASFARPRA